MGVMCGENLSTGVMCMGHCVMRPCFFSHHREVPPTSMMPLPSLCDAAPLVFSSQDSTSGLNGATALIEASYMNNVKVLNILLAAKADKEARTSVGVRPYGGEAGGGSAPQWEARWSERKVH